MDDDLVPDLYPHTPIVEYDEPMPTVLWIDATHAIVRWPRFGFARHLDTPSA